LPEDITKDTVNLLSKFIAVKEPNIRCLALEALTKTKPHHMTTLKMKENLPLLLQGLKEPDLSIRRRCLDTLFQQCNNDISGEIINELLDHLQEQNDF
jgi:AP-2 complex subunit alpha